MTNRRFSTPIEDRYFEDYLTGTVYMFGPIAVQESEIISFAKRFDPQSIHIDPEEAAKGPSGA